MRRLTSLFRKRKFEAQIDSQLRFHIEQKTADVIAQSLALRSAPVAKIPTPRRFQPHFSLARAARCPIDFQLTVILSIQNMPRAQTTRQPSFCPIRYGGWRMNSVS